MKSQCFNVTMLQSIIETYHQIISQFVSFIEKTIQRCLHVEELPHQTRQRGSHCEDVVNILKQILNHLSAQSHQIYFGILLFTEECSEKLTAIFNTKTRKIGEERGEGSKSKENRLVNLIKTKPLCYNQVWSSHVTESQIQSQNCHLNGLAQV